MERPPEHKEQKKSPDEIIGSLWERLPNMAKSLIDRSVDTKIEKNRRFYENPDAVEEHKPEWHQWGVITHTKKFEEFYRTEIPGHLEEWGIADDVAEAMSEEIDGVAKSDLLRMSIPLHDLGKFSGRRLKKRSDGTFDQDFPGHEAASGRIIRSAEFSETFKRDYGLTDAQVEYLARCAELHYELAKIRDRAKQTPMGYTMSFIKSPEFSKAADAIMDRFSDAALEVGLLYLADSLGKTEFRLKGETDEEIAAQKEQAEKLVYSRGINPKNVNTVLQLPINIASSGAYLKRWVDRQK